MLIYQQMIKLIWIYGIKIWDFTKKSNIEIIENF